jgi:hypothetical protein
MHSLILHSKYTHYSISKGAAYKCRVVSLMYRLVLKTLDTWFPSRIWWICDDFRLGGGRCFHVCINHFEQRLDQKCVWAYSGQHKLATGKWSARSVPRKVSNSRNINTLAAAGVIVVVPAATISAQICKYARIPASYLLHKLTAYPVKGQLPI